jgi:hypothetical protein
MHRSDNRETRIYGYGHGTKGEALWVLRPHPSTIVLLPTAWLATPFIYADKVNDQKGYLEISYDMEGNVLEISVVSINGEFQIFLMTLGKQGKNLHGTELSQIEMVLDMPEEMNATLLGSVALYKFPESRTLPDIETDYIYLTYDREGHVSDYLRTARRVDSSLI